ncbi:sensor histidine kinase [Luteibacter sp. CQ10]|uniref:sensor histidine kinase n=1 Tax=Luteibacter sp. CQ10 TaxID=2805821 RepID=UPI0034A3C6DD
MSPPPRPLPTGLLDRGATRVPRALAAVWIAFCLLMICSSLQDALRNPRIRWWEPVVWEGSSALVGTVWMFLAIRARPRYAAYLDRPAAWFGRYLRWLPLTAVTFIVSVYAIRHGVYALMGRTYEHPGWPFLFAYESVRLSLFVGLWLGVLFGFDSYRQWQDQRHRLLQTQKALTDARLAQLQGQLRPHFLFNALNTISALMHTDVPRADHLVATLGDLLRVSLRTLGNEMTPLAEELRVLELYADIMRERFRHRVTLDWDIDRTLLDKPVPSLLLQPLLENAFKHGVERTVIPVHIQVTLKRTGRMLGLEVSNSGGLPETANRDGVGLRNCRDRLAILYGDDASLAIGQEGDVVVARIALPLVEATS